MSAKRTAPLRWRQFLTAITPTRGLSQFFIFIFPAERPTGGKTDLQEDKVDRKHQHKRRRATRPQAICQAESRGGSRDTPPSVSAVGRPLFTQMTDGGVGVGRGEGACVGCVSRGGVNPGVGPLARVAAAAENGRRRRGDDPPCCLGAVEKYIRLRACELNY